MVKLYFKVGNYALLAEWMVRYAQNRFRTGFLIDRKVQ